MLSIRTWRFTWPGKQIPVVQSLYPSLENQFNQTIVRLWDLNLNIYTWQRMALEEVVLIVHIRFYFWNVRIFRKENRAVVFKYIVPRVPCEYQTVCPMTPSFGYKRPSVSRLTWQRKIDLNCLEEFYWVITETSFRHVLIVAAVLKRKPYSMWVSMTAINVYTFAWVLWEVKVTCQCHHLDSEDRNMEVEFQITCPWSTGIKIN